VRSHRLRPTLPAALLAAAPLSLTAAEPTPPVPPTESDHSAHVGLTLNAGNSESLRLNVGVVSAAALDEATTYQFGADYNYGESSADDRPSRRDVDNGKLSAFVRTMLRAPWFAAVDTSALFDHMADIEHRVTVGPALGVELVRRAGLRWSVELGPAVLWERVAGVNDQYLAVRVSEQFEWRPDDRLRVWHRVEWTAEGSDPANALFNAELGIESRVGQRTWLRSVLQDRYDARPAPGLRHTDVSLVTGLAVEL